MILSRAHVLLRDDRSDLRINETGRTSWQIKYKQREGVAKVRNISASGMLMETDAAFDPKEECIFSFESRLGDKNYIPQVGRLVWHKKKRFSRKKYLCGIKFLEADEQVLGQMRQRVREGITRFLRKRRIITAIGLLLCLALIGLTGYVVWMSGAIYQDITTANQRIFRASEQGAVLTQSYAQLYQASELNLTQATVRLDIATNKLGIANKVIEKDKEVFALFAKELEATKALLNQTETMLTQSNDRNIVFNRDLQVLRDQVEVQTETVKENATVTADIKARVTAYRLELRSIRDKIKNLRNQERAARVAAIAQMDSQKLRLGNNGYFVKSGQTVQVDEEQYRRLTAEESSSPAASQTNRKVEIDVTFFE